MDFVYRYIFQFTKFPVFASFLSLGNNDVPRLAAKWARTGYDSFADMRPNPEQVGILSMPILTVKIFHDLPSLNNCYQRQIRKSFDLEYQNRVSLRINLEYSQKGKTKEATFESFFSLLTLLLYNVCVDYIR